MAWNKIDANDADGVAHLTEAGFYREVRVESFETMLTRTLVAECNQMLKATTQLSHQIWGLMAFGLVVSKGAGGVFKNQVRGFLTSNTVLKQIILPVLEAWGAMRTRVAELSKQLIIAARVSEQCQLLSSIPGIGAVTASSFAAAIEGPENFRKSRSAVAWLGLTTRRYQSDEVDYDGLVSWRGDNHLRGLLHEPATVILARTLADSSLRTWGLKLREKVGLKRAAVAVARKLAVIMHAMLRAGELFEHSVTVLA